MSPCWVVSGLRLHLLLGSVACTLTCAYTDLWDDKLDYLNDVPANTAIILPSAFVISKVRKVKCV